MEQNNPEHPKLLVIQRVIVVSMPYAFNSTMSDCFGVEILRKYQDALGPFFYIHNIHTVTNHDNRLLISFSIC